MAGGKGGVPHSAPVPKLTGAARATPAPMAEFGTLLRRLHDEPVPPFRVRDLEDPFASVAAALDRAAGGLEDSDRAWLRERIRRLRIRWRELDPVVPPGLIHGDARTLATYCASQAAA